MIRLPEFDRLNAHKRQILKVLDNGREFSLREITELVVVPITCYSPDESRKKMKKRCVEMRSRSRSTTWEALKVLINLGFVAPTKATSKKLIKPHWSAKIQKLNRDRVRFCLTENGKYCVEYYFGNLSEAKN